MLDEHNIPKKTNLGFLRIIETNLENDSWSDFEENRRKTLIKDILEGKYETG